METIVGLVVLGGVAALVIWRWDCIKAKLTGETPKVDEWNGDDI